MLEFFSTFLVSVFIKIKTLTITTGIIPKAAAATAAKSRQSCPTLCDPINGSPPGSAFPGILQATHWSGLSFPSPMHESEKLKVKLLSRV